MSPITFIDTNVPIYAAGREHTLKEPCAQILLLVAEQAQVFVTDAEVLQELLHSYLAIGLCSQGKKVFQGFRMLMQERIEAVQAEDVELAAGLADEFQGLGGRDLLHAAVMHRLDVRQIISADRGFDRIPGVERLDPARLPIWQNSLLQ